MSEVSWKSIKEFRIYGADMNSRVNPLTLTLTLTLSLGSWVMCSGRRLIKLHISLTKRNI